MYIVFLPIIYLRFISSNDFACVIHCVWIIHKLKSLKRLDSPSDTSCTIEDRWFHSMYQCREILQKPTVYFFYISKSRKENPQKLTQLSSRSHPRHLVGKRTAQKDITIDTTSDSQAISNLPNRRSPASLTFNNYFYLFCCLYIT